MAQLDTSAWQYLHCRAPFFMTHRNFFFFNIEKKLWKVVQSQVKLMRINFKFEAPILQVQIITNIIYSNLIRPNRNVWGLDTFSQYVTQDKIIAKWSVAYQYWKSISIERVISIYIYLYMYREFLAGILFLWSYTRCMSKFGWAITEELSIRRRVRLNQSTKFWSVGDRKHVFWWFMSSGLW